MSLRDLFEKKAKDLFEEPRIYTIEELEHMTGFEEFMSAGTTMKADDMTVQGEDLTIKGWSKKEPFEPGKPPRMVLSFHEIEQELGLNQTNIKMLKVFFPEAGPDDLLGKRINVYKDPTVSINGKVVGGLRIRLPIHGGGGGTIGGGNGAPPSANAPTDVVGSFKKMIAAQSDEAGLKALGEQIKGREDLTVEQKTELSVAYEQAKQAMAAFG